MSDRDFTTYANAVIAANFRAAVTRRRYRVTKDRANDVWCITETTATVGGQIQIGSSE